VIAPTALVVGAGVFGVWTAWRLAQDGWRVTLLDAYGPGNGRASSADHSRVIRAGYGRDAIYSRWATASLADWQWLETHAGMSLLTHTGALFLGEPGSAYLRDSFATLSALGRDVEWLERETLAARYPQIATGGLGPALFEADAGVLRARLAVRALARIACAAGQVDYRLAHVLPLDEDAVSPTIVLSGGSAVAADVYVIACGPWLPRLLPRAVGTRIRPTRQEVLYFGIPRADPRFSHPGLPVWIDFGAGVYGIPDLDSQGFKVGVDRHGPPLDPDTDDRLVTPDIVASVRAWLATRFPDLADAPLVDSRVCQYENSSTGDFILDRHPAWSNMWIAGGGSGHGFKHAPAVGRYLADRIAGRGVAEPRFALPRKDTGAAREVY
jgi:sarcosine oxidase